MEKFIKLKEDVSLRTVAEQMTDDRIIILRESKTTGTIQIQLISKMSSRQIRDAFRPYTVEKIYDDFPYPLSGDRFLAMPLLRLKRMFV
ncbi:hypothetical protein JW960_24195 [candidate division KSB1 bacterium]|nr:hypothetical protein [candidate division KSB1 bacterium]